MIAYLRGQLIDKGTDHVVIDVHGVGYRVTVSQTSMAQMPEIGAQAQLRIHTHVREDALSLFGFSSAEEEELFHHLTAVSGVGPRLGINILSGMQPQELAYAIAHNELARLTKIGGVGKKTAERLVVELADKLKGSTLLLKRVGPAPAGRTKAGVDELVSALTNLGYRPAEAERAASAAREAQPGADLEVLLRTALQLILSKAV
jgi:Holliday junction DNA helicase RuvA